jgi:hypothetical protein
MENNFHDNLRECANAPLFIMLKNPICIIFHQILPLAKIKFQRYENSDSLFVP